MPRAGLNAEAVLDLAFALLDEGGPEVVTLAAVAQRAGVAPPSLYKHVDGLDGLRAAMAARAMEELTSCIAAAALGRARGDAVRAVMQSYRQYAVDHPGRYRMIPAQPFTEPNLNRSATGLLDVVMAVIHGYGLADDEAIHMTRALRSTAHGFVDIEIADGFGLPHDIDASYDRLIGLVVAGIETTMTASGGTNLADGV